LINSFAYIFFTPNKHVQEKYIIVGPVRIRTWHTTPIDCPLKTALDNCYDLSMELLDTSPKDGINYQTCS
jgi:hypothetical protein